MEAGTQGTALRKAGRGMGKQGATGGANSCISLQPANLFPGNAAPLKLLEPAG